MAVTITAAELAEAVGTDSATATRLVGRGDGIGDAIRAGRAGRDCQRRGDPRGSGWLAEHPAAAITSETEGDIRTSPMQPVYDNPRFDIPAGWPCCRPGRSAGRARYDAAACLAAFPERGRSPAPGAGRLQRVWRIRDGRRGRNNLSGAGIAVVPGGFRFCWRRVPGRAPERFSCRAAWRAIAAKPTRWRGAATRLLGTASRFAGAAATGCYFPRIRCRSWPRSRTGRPICLVLCGDRIHRRRVARLASLHPRHCAAGDLIVRWPWSETGATR